MKCNAYNEFRCRSCDYLEMSYFESLKEKEHIFSETFKGVEIDKILPTVGLREPHGSRNKAKLAVALINNEIKFGIYSREMIFSELNDCPLHQNEINELLNPLSGFLKNYNIIPYDLKTQKGELKYVLITRSQSSKEIMLRFVLRSKESIDRLRKMTLELQDNWPSLSMVSVNIQPEHKAILEGEIEVIFTKSNSITHYYSNYNIKLGAKSFFQVTSEIAQKLYQSVADYVKNKKGKNILDLYCGVGAFSMYVSKSALSVVGVEISPDAIAFANENKRLNQLQNIDFYALDVNQFLLSDSVSFDTVIVNPPRRGLGINNVELILKINPQMLIYSSCNVITLRSDLELLKRDFKIDTAQIFDMFPFSKHFETVVTLSRIC